MLFGLNRNKNASLQRRYKQRVVSTTLQARLRSDSKRKLNTKLLAGFLGIVVIAGIVAALWFAVLYMRELLFTKNDFYNIKTIEISDEEALVRTFLLNRYGVTEGKNLFAFNISKFQSEFKKSAPSIKEIEIYRVLPDKLKIEIGKRIPLVRIGKDGLLVADAEGNVFISDQIRNNGVFITGWRGMEIKPGDNLSGIMMDAIKVIDLCDKTKLGQELEISKIDVRGGFGGRTDSLRLQLSDGTEVDLWWDRMKGTQEAANDLADRLRFLVTIIRKSRNEGKMCKNINLTLDNYRRNCPVTLRWN